MSAAHWPYPRILAHRGGGTIAPENTLAGMRYAASLGYRGVEFDVMLAGDGVPVLIHDQTTERTTGTKGEVAATPSARLAMLDAGVWRGERWRGEPVPRFDQAARLCRELGLWANVEIKPASGHERVTGAAVARMARELWGSGEGAPLLSSFSLDALGAAREAAPELKRGYVVREVPDNVLDTLRELGAFSLHCRFRTLSPAHVRDVREAGYALAAWTVNDPADVRRLIAWGADCVITDALGTVEPDIA